MINVTCPKCGETLEAPEAMASQAETCPACGNMCIVPLPAVPLDLAPRRPWLVAVAERTTRRIGGAWSAIRRRPRRAMVIGGAVVIVMALGVAAAVGPNGEFPPRTEIDRILSERGYYAVVGGASNILRGRRMNRYMYAPDANSPWERTINVWCELTDDQRVAAISTLVHEFLYEPTVPLGTQQWLDMASHSHAVSDVLDAVAGNCPYLIPQMTDGGSSSQSGRRIVSKTVGGFELERTWAEDFKREYAGEVLVILKDRSWECDPR